MSSLRNFLSLAFVAFMFSLALTPLLRDLFRRVNMLDYPDEARKRHLQPVPRVGGIAIAASYGATLLLAVSLRFLFPTGLVGMLGIIVNLLPAALLIFVTGFVDDVFKLSARFKLFFQLIAAGLAYWAGIQIRIPFGFSINNWVSLPLTVVWLVGCSNAFNLIDGVDGLAAGVALLSALTMAVAALMHDRLDLVLLTLPLVGCLLGFLRYNFNPASVFLGDSGSLLLGFILACYSVLWSQLSATVLGLAAPLMVMAIPLLDVGLSIARRFIRGRPILQADRGHIHHMLLDRGLTPCRVVLLIYVCCGLAGALSLLAGTFHNQFSGLVLLLFGAGIWIGIRQLRYVEFSVARQMLTKGTFQHIVDAQSRLAQFEHAVSEANSFERCCELLIDCARDFAFISVRWNVRGHAFERVVRRVDPGSCWQLRLTLPDRQYVNFERPYDTEINFLVLGEFVRVVERALKGSLEKRETEPVRLSALKETVTVMRSVAKTAG
jgi:UDP-GlcNAc:undecaprenyl-phosphate/decaprenyl-phosphate GlcNAc-1-phosphate transferase